MPSPAHRQDNAWPLSRRSTLRLLISLPKIVTIVFAGRNETVPVNLETVCEPAHGRIQRTFFAHRAQIIAVGFMLRQADDFAVAEFAQKGNVSLSYRRA